MQQKAYLCSLDREELICYKKYVIRRYRREVIVLRRYGNAEERGAM